jgi:alkylation response protein AidB-like acyl-CoA dehydrogenase
LDFSLDETQQAVAELAASVLRAEPDDGRVLAALGSTGGYDEAAWKAMGQSGLLALALPDAVGGDAMGPLATALVLTEVGRQTLPLPALATLALGVLPIAAYGTDGQHRALLPEVADGRILTAALRDAPGAPVTVIDELCSGSRIGVPYAEQAHRILVPTADATAIIDPHADGVTLHRTTTSTGAPEYTVRLDRVRAESVLPATAADIDRFAVVGAAAVADGVITAALSLTSTHLRTREQFGRPLATFQAVAQQVADVYITARTVHLAAVSAAWRLDSGRDADEDLAIAAYWLAAELPRALQVCHHLHGGLGVDVTYPLHRYYSQAKDVARLVGGVDHRLDRLADPTAGGTDGRRA